MKGMILVTGGTGLVGRFAVEELLRRNCRVRVLARAESVSAISAQSIEVVTGDLSDVSSLHRAMEGVTGVVHAACTFRDSAVDVAAMRALLKDWREGPFVFISSLDVYGFTQSDPITEQHPLSTTYNDYATGKVVCEQLLQEAAREQRRKDFSILRAPYIWGPHRRARERLVNARLGDGKDMILPGSSEAEWKQYRDVWIDTRDLAWIIAECLEAPAADAINVLSGHFCWHDLFAELIALTGSKSTIVHKPLADIEETELPRKILYAQTWRFSDAKLKKHIPFVPRYTLQQTLRATVEQSPGVSECGA